MKNSDNRARHQRESFTAWARRSAIPMPASPEEPLGEAAQAALDRMLEGKRFVFLGFEDGSVGSHLHKRFPEHVLSIWMLYGEGTLMMPAGPRTVRLHGDTIESLLAQVGNRFLLPLQDVSPQARVVLANANFRSSQGLYASADLTAQADAVYFVKDVNAE